MKSIRKIKYLASTFAVVAASTVAVAVMNHANHATQVGKVVLKEAGTDPFATIQEVISTLEANPNTNWEKINIEALRQHLVEMEDMTLNVNVSQHPIDKGFKAVVTPTTKRAKKSLTAVLSAHPAQMRAETNWQMQVENNNGIFTLAVTSDNPKEVAKIRGLGYIGIMAYGLHHQQHHWAMASGNHPHAQHNMRH